jgi:hypothetical protein
MKLKLHVANIDCAPYPAPRIKLGYIALWEFITREKEKFKQRKDTNES